MSKYVLGVDGGNTKTHYFLYTLEGEFKGAHASGTCSHEAVSGGFDGARIELEKNISLLFTKCGVTMDDIAFASFGLAGADFEWQKRKLSEIIDNMGFGRFIVDNDGFFALKAGASTGAGICSINGTGTVTVGVNERGDRLQVGGIGEISGDSAGAKNIAVRGVRAIYDMLYKSGAETQLKKSFYERYAVQSDEDFVLKAMELLETKEAVLEINQMMEAAEMQGDEVVREILREIGDDLGATAAGCMNRLGFEGEVEIVLAGSVWAKGKFTELESAFIRRLKKAGNNAFRITKLLQPPAIGAIIWAIEEIKRGEGLSLSPEKKRAILSDEKWLHAFGSVDPSV